MSYTKLGDINGNLLGTAGVKFIGPVILRDTMQLEAGASILSANFASGTTGFKLSADGTGELYGDLSVGGDISLDSGSLYTALDRTGSEEYLAIGNPHGTGAFEEISWFRGATQRAMIAASGATYSIITLNAIVNLAAGSIPAGQTAFELAAGSTWGKGVADLYVGLYNKSSTEVWANADGAQSTPSYTFGLDKDTGFYRYGSNALAASAGGTQIWYGTTTAFGSPLAYSQTSASSPNVYVDSGGKFHRSTSSPYSASIHDSDHLDLSGSIRPSANNTYDIGYPTTERWKDIYMVGGTTAGATDIHIDATTGKLLQVTSSRRFKKHIKDYHGGMELLQSVRPRSFQWKKGLDDANPDGQVSVGMIAEELIEVAPEYVNLDESGEPWSIRYSAFVVPLIDAVRELSEEVARLRAIVEA